MTISGNFNAHISDPRGSLEKYELRYEGILTMIETIGKPKAQVKISQYQKPIFLLQEGLTFPREVIEQFNGNRFCVQCSSCHGCK